MKIERQIKRVFGMQPSPSVEGAPSNSLARIGYPLLYQVSFFIRIDGLERWRTSRRLNFPDRCCACSQPSVTELDCKRSAGLRRWITSRAGLRAVPHCAFHARDGQCKLLVESVDWTPAVVRVSLVGLDAGFLEDTRALNQESDVPPPWVAFGQADAFSSNWRQGNNEYWWRNEWLPFWHGMSAEKRQRYLERHAASDEWTEYLAKSE